MGGKEQENKESLRRIMVNSDEEIVEALKEINETLKVKDKRNIICKEGKENIEYHKHTKSKGGRRENHYNGKPSQP
jgi:DNA helicase IV